MRYIEKILLVDNHKIVVDGLRGLVRPYSRQILEAYHLDTAVALAKEHKPNLAIVDYRLGPNTADELIREIHYYAPATRILVYSFTTTEKAVRQTVAAGAHGYIQKGDDVDELLEALEALMDGRVYYNETARFYLTKMLDITPNHHYVEIIGGVSFNDKEIQIIRLLVEELSAKEIARRIFLSESSVEQYKIKIARKMGVKNTAGILKFAFKHGMINQDDL